MDEPTKAVSAGQTPDERAREVAASMFDGTIITESRMAATIAEAIRAAEAAAYERGKLVGQVEEQKRVADKLDSRAIGARAIGNASEAALWELAAAAARSREVTPEYAAAYFAGEDAKPSSAVLGALRERGQKEKAGD